MSTSMVTASPPISPDLPRLAALAALHALGHRVEPGTPGQDRRHRRVELPVLVLLREDEQLAPLLVEHLDFLAARRRDVLREPRVSVVRDRPGVDRLRERLHRERHRTPAA